jgi:hypothetical protein
VDNREGGIPVRGQFSSLLWEVAERSTGDPLSIVPARCRARCPRSHTTHSPYRWPSGASLPQMPALWLERCAPPCLARSRTAGLCSVRGKPREGRRTTQTLGAGAAPPHAQPSFHWRECAPSHAHRQPRPPVTPRPPADFKMKPG